MTDDSTNALQRGLEKIRDPFSSFIRAQTTSSWFLLLATIVALWWANSDYYSTYENLTHTPVGFFLGEFELRASLKHIINDGLMVIFFFLLGLEIKREVLAGDLTLPENRRMLILCAIGGMACPAAISRTLPGCYSLPLHRNLNRRHRDHNGSSISCEHK